MDVLVERCAGLDVHRDTVVATVRIPAPGAGRRREQATRTFVTTTAGITALGDWLAEHRITRVGMESTGVYWKPVYYLLEDEFECWLLNAQHLRNVPGRKTDVADAAWICQLVEHGLVRPSFVPPKPIRELRELTRYRKTLIHERTREVQRLHKLLEDAGIKLGCVASDVLGVSGRLMLEALVGGRPIPRCWPTWPEGHCARSLRCCGRRSRAAWHATIGCSWPSCSLTWTIWMRQSSG